LVEAPNEIGRVHSPGDFDATAKVTLHDVGVLVEFDNVAARSLNTGGQACNDPGTVR
jgi:hypothetical protein